MTSRNEEIKARVEDAVERILAHENPLRRPKKAVKKPRTRPATYADRLNDYARSVVAGDTPAGKYVKLACARHLKDLEASASTRYPYYFDEAEVIRNCTIVEKLPHTKGKWARNRETIKLGDWQVFIIGSIFGWKRRKDKMRRFRDVYLEIPRKNGKSILAAAIGIIMWGFDGEFGAEVYSGATTEAQAWEVFRPAKQMVERTEELRKDLGAEVWAKTLLIPTDDSKFHPIIGKPGDGQSPSCAIIDEYHEHDTPDMVDTMETGMGSREQPLLLKITTAGVNLAGPCFSQHLASKHVLDGVLEDDRHFAMIFGIDEDDKWEHPSSLRKANPNFGVSVDEEFLLAQQKGAMMNPVMQTKFKTKHLNVWCAVKNALFNLQHWNNCEDRNLVEEEFIEDSEVNRWIAADLASKLDLCTSQRLYRRMVTDPDTQKTLPHYYLFGRYWLPEESIEEPGPNMASYKKWVAEGWLIPTDGAVIDFDEIAEVVIEDIKRTHAEEFIFDPFNATNLSTKVLEKGGIAIEFQQTPQNFAVPIDELQAAMKDGRFHHDGNPITTWCIANTMERVTKKGLSAPIKLEKTQKIDGAVAVIMAMSRAAAELGDTSFSEVLGEEEE